MTEGHPRRLGQHGSVVSAMGLGCWAIGGPFWADSQPLGWGTVDDQESTTALHCALDLGVTLFDTADVYGTGHSERVLGKALGSERHRVVVATKFGNTFDETTRQLTGSDISPTYIRSACEASLRRLQTDWIDLYQMHVDCETERVPEVVETLENLVADGLIRGYGWSTDDPEAAALFAVGQHCLTVQHELNVLHDAPGMLALCEREGLGSVNRSPLGMGLLTGKFTAGQTLPQDDVRGQSPEWLRFFQDGRPTPEWLTKVEQLQEHLQVDGRSLAQGALAWIWTRSPVTVPIPGFRTAEQVRTNAQAMQFGRLSDTQFRAVETVLQALR